MSSVLPTMSGTSARRKQINSVLRALKKDYWLYIMLVPGIVYYILFKFLPMPGMILAFKNYQPLKGIWGSPWAGLYNFHLFLGTSTFWLLMRNTLVLAMMNIVFFFPLPIVVALLLNELKSQIYKRVVQSIIYIPHFFSWVVIGGISYVLFTTEGGAVNDVLESLIGRKVNFLASETAFRPFILGQTIWKETGWGTIIFLAAIAGIDPGLYEAAAIDGAGRLRRMIHITFPSLVPTIIVLLILRLGHFMDLSFEQLFVMVNAGNRSVGQTFDIYVYEAGIREGRFAYTTAVGIFKSVISFVLVLSSDFFAKKLGSEGIL